MLLHTLVNIILAASLFGVSRAVPSHYSKRQAAPAQIVTKCTVPNTVALTFDDGPYEYVHDVSNTLRAAGALGTFFFNGNNFRCIYGEDQVKRVKFLHEQGHQLASHTWSHKNLSTLSWDELHTEFWLVEEALRRITGVVPAFARPPFGEFNELVTIVAGMRGQTLALWDFDSGDTLGVPVEEQKARYTELAAAHPETALALNHDIIATTAYDVLPHAVQVLQAAGYRMVTLAECLGMPAYQSIGLPELRDESWTC